MGVAVECKMNTFNSSSHHFFFFNLILAGKRGGKAGKSSGAYNKSMNTATRYNNVTQPIISD